MTKFATSHEAVQRVVDPRPINVQEARELIPHSVGLGQHIHTFNAHLAVAQIVALNENEAALHQNTEAIRSFDESSTKLTKWVIGLTWTLVFLTIVITIVTVMLWIRS